MAINVEIVHNKEVIIVGLTDKKYNMKVLKIIIPVLFLCSSCVSKTEDCIKSAMKAGYSYKEAKNMCEDAQMDSGIR